MPELTDEEIAQVQRLQTMVQQLQANPEARAHLERGLKVLNPQLTTTEETIEAIRAPVMSELEQMKAELARRDQEAADRARQEAEQSAISRMNQSFQRLREQFGLTEEGEGKVRELMTQRNIFDPEAAFALFEKQNPTISAEHANWTPDHWNYATDLMPDAKQWFQDPDRAADQAIGQVLTEMRRNGSGE